MSGKMNLEGKVIENLGAGSDPNDAVNYSQLATKLSLSGGVMTGALQMGGKKIENVAASTSLTDAVTRAELNNKFNVTGGAITGSLDMGSNNITNVNLINNISLSSMKTSLDSIETKAFHLGYTAPNNNPLLTMNGDVKAKSFVKNGALASEFLMGDGSTMAGSDASLKSNFYRFTVSTDAVANPDPGQIVFNNPTQASATEIKINRMTSDNLNIRFIFDMLSSLNEIYVRASGSDTDYIKYGVRDVPSVLTSYVVIPVVMRTSAGAGAINFASGADVLIAFFADLKEANTRLTALEAGVVSIGDNVSGGYLPLTGGTLTGGLTMGANKITATYTPSADADLVNKGYVDGVVANSGGGGSGDYLPLGGGTLSGGLNMGVYKITANYTPSDDTDLVTKTYVDNAITNSGGGGSGDYLPLTGGDIMGSLTASSFSVPFMSGFLMANGEVNNNSYVNTSENSYVTGEITAHKFIKLDGTAQQYLMADGSSLQYSANSGNSNFYLYKSSISTEMPWDGYISYNTPAQSDATTIYVSYKTRDDINIEIFYKTISTLNIVYIQSQSSASDYIKYDITGIPDITDGVRIAIPVVMIESAGLGTSNFVTDSDVILSFFTNNIDTDIRLSNLENTYLKKDGTVAMTGTLLMGNNKITSTYIPFDDADLVNKLYVDEAVTNIGGGGSGDYLPLTGGVLTGALMATGFRVANSSGFLMADETVNTDSYLKSKDFWNNCPFIERTNTSEVWTDVCWSSELNLFVAVASDGAYRVMTSHNGIDWASRECPIATWTRVCWSADVGLFVAISSVSPDKQVMTSLDGITWTSRECPEGTWRGVCWSPEVESFVAIANSGSNLAMNSPDGVIWTAQSCPSGLWRDICWAPELGLFVAVSRGGDNLIMTSTDGVIWNARGCPTGLWRCVCWSPEVGLLVAVAGDYNTSDIIMTSTNGINWTLRTGSAQQWVSIRWIAELGIFVAISSDTIAPSYIMTSSDGITWSSRAYDIRLVSAICWSPELYMFAAAAHEIIYTQSADIGLGSYLKIDGSRAMTGSLNMGANKITSTYIPSDNADLVNKSYVDEVVANIGGGGGYVNTTGDSTIAGEITAHKFIKLDGTAQQYLMADGSSLQYSANSGNSNFYLYKSSISTEMPIDGYISYNNPTQSNATFIYVSYKTRDDINIEVFYKSLSRLNVVYIQSQSSALDYIKYDITGIPDITNGVRIAIPVVMIESAGLGTSNFASDSDVILSFFTNNIDTDIRLSNLENTYLKKDGTVAMTGTLLMGNNKITSTYTPSDDTDLVNKGYVDGKLLTCLTYKNTSPYWARQPWITQTTSNNEWKSVCWSNEVGLFVAVSSVGDANKIMTSSNGINWITHTSVANNEWTSVCWSKEVGLFVAVSASGNANRVMTSSNGINWITQTSAANNLWTSVCWSKEVGLFVAVALYGDANSVMTSPNGINWTAQSSAANKIWKSVCWSPEVGLFVAVADSVDANCIMTSTNGIDWVMRACAPGNMNWSSVCWSKEVELFVAVSAAGYANCVMTSSNGIDWTLRSITNNEHMWFSVCWAKEVGLFVAVSVGRVMTSPNGINWTLRLIANNLWTSVCWSPEQFMFVAVASSGTANRVMTSPP